MTVCQSQFGEIVVFSDFTGDIESTVVTTTGNLLPGGIGLVGVNEGSIINVADETNGILLLTTDTADNDNECLICGPFAPQNGGIVFEARFTLISATLAAIYAGLSETLSLTTPVVPAYFVTTTMTYNGTGGMAGLLFDPDGTTADWRALFGDAGAVVTGADANGTRANATITADSKYICRVEVDPNGTARCYLGHDKDSLVLVKSVATALTKTDLFYAILMIENRTGAASTIEVDYFYCKTYRDWTV